MHMMVVVLREPLRWLITNGLQESVTNLVLLSTSISAIVKVTKQVN